MPCENARSTAPKPPRVSAPPVAAAACRNRRRESRASAIRRWIVRGCCVLSRSSLRPDAVQQTCPDMAQLRCQRRRHDHCSIEVMALAERLSQYATSPASWRSTAGAGLTDGSETIRRSRRPSDDAEEFARDVEALGPTFIKLGQLLSTRADVLPPAYVGSAGSACRTTSKPFPFSDVVRIVEEELGVRLSKALRRVRRDADRRGVAGPGAPGGAANGPRSRRQGAAPECPRTGAAGSGRAWMRWRRCSSASPA